MDPDPHTYKELEQSTPPNDGTNAKTKVMKEGKKKNLDIKAN